MSYKKLFPSEYSVWVMIKQRILNPKNKSFKNYGGRGITISKEWKHSFENFINDMGTRPNKNSQIDRINNNGNYCKENCRWVSPSKNQLNRGLYKGSLPRCIQRVGNKYRCQISLNGRQFHIGIYITISEAILNRDIMYKEWYGIQPIEKRK